MILKVDHVESELELRILSWDDLIRNIESRLVILVSERDNRAFVASLSNCETNAPDEIVVDSNALHNRLRLDADVDLVDWLLILEKLWCFFSQATLMIHDLVQVLCRWLITSVKKDTGDLVNRSFESNIVLDLVWVESLWYWRSWWVRRRTRCRAWTWFVTTTAANSNGDDDDHDDERK